MIRFSVTFLAALLMTSEVSAQTNKNGATSVVKNVSMTIVASIGRPVNQNEFITLKSNDEETRWQYFNSLGIMTAEGSAEISAQRLSSALEDVFEPNSTNQSTRSEKEKPLFFFSILYFVDGKPTVQPTMSNETHGALKRNATFHVLFSSIKKQVFGKKPAMPKLWQPLNGADVTIGNSLEKLEPTSPPSSFVAPPSNKKVKPPRLGGDKNG